MLITVSFDIVSSDKTDREDVQRLVQLALAHGLSALGLGPGDVRFQVQAQTVGSDEEGEGVTILVREGQPIPLAEVPAALQGSHSLYQVMIRKTAEYLAVWFGEGPPGSEETHLARKDEMDGLPQSKREIMILQERLKSQGLACLCGYRLRTPFGFVPILPSQMDDGITCPQCLLIWHAEEDI